MVFHFSFFLFLLPLIGSVVFGQGRCDDSGGNRLRIRVAGMLGFKAKAVGHGPEQHFRELDPAFRKGRCHESLQIVAAHKRHWTMPHFHRISLQHSVRHVPMHERKSLQKKIARLFHAFPIGAPVLEAVVGKVAQNVKSFRRRNVPHLALLHLCEHPRLDDGAASKQHRGNLCTTVKSNNKNFEQEKKKKLNSQTLSCSMCCFHVT